MDISRLLTVLNALSGIDELSPIFLEIQLADKQGEALFVISEISGVAITSGGKICIIGIESLSDLAYPTADNGGQRRTTAACQSLA